MELPSPEGKLHLVSTSAGRMLDLAKLLENTKKLKVPTIVFLEGQDNLVEALTRSLSEKYGELVEEYSEQTQLDLGKVYVSSFEKLSLHLDELVPKYKTVTTIFGECSELAQKVLSGLKPCEIIVEDLGKNKHILQSRASFVVTPSSFTYHIVELFNWYDKS